MGCAELAGGLRGGAVGRTSVREQRGPVRALHAADKGGASSEERLCSLHREVIPCVSWGGAVHMTGTCAPSICVLVAVPLTGNSYVHTDVLLQDKIKGSYDTF